MIQAVAFISAGLAAALHVFIFVLETLLWQSDRARKTFGTTPEQAKATRKMAANQGVYNLLFALMAFAGIALSFTQPTVGTALIIAGVGCMFIAASYLFATAPTKRAAAVKQGVLPLITLLTLLVTLLVR